MERRERESGGQGEGEGRPTDVLGEGGGIYMVLNFISGQRVRFRYLLIVVTIVSYLNGCAFASLRFADTAPKQLEIEMSATEFIGPRILKLKCSVLKFCYIRITTIIIIIIPEH